MGATAAPQKVRILIVDDDGESLELMWQWLALQGHDLAIARSGREALDRIRSSPPDLILLDVKHPAPEGLEVARAIKGDPANRTIPLIVTSVRRDPQTRVECIRLGVDDFVTKPFHWDELDATLQAALEKRRLYTALEEANQRLQAANTQLMKIAPGSTTTATCASASPRSSSAPCATAPPCRSSCSIWITSRA
jgi:two-component system NtrC family sensor kinase